MRKLVITSMVVAALLVIAVPALAAPAKEDPADEIDLLTGILKDFITTSGLALVVPLVVQILKRTGLIPDGQSGVWCAGLCVVLWLIYTGLQAFGVIPPGFMDDMAGISEIAARILQFVITVVLPLFGFSQARAAALPGLRYSLTRTHRRSTR